MTNHYHLLIETPEGNLAKGMRQLNGVYTQMVNRTYGRTGHVFQGRYQAILVEKDSYLLELARYVVLNPVRAGMVSEVGDWPWSSYPAMIDQAPSPVWLQTDWLLGQFSPEVDQARLGYLDFVRAGLGLPRIWNNLQGQIYLGSEAFIQRMQSSLPSEHALDEIPRRQRRPLAKPLMLYRTEFTDDAHTGMALAYRTGNYTMKAIADAFGVHYTTVSRAVSAYELKLDP